MHMYFEDEEKKTKKQPLNSKFVIIIMQTIKQRLNEALLQDVFIGHNCSNRIRNYFCGYYEIINFKKKSFMLISVLSCIF